MKTKIIALDVYGTILPSQGYQYARFGTTTFLERCKLLKAFHGVKVCTCSDADTKEMLSDLVLSHSDLERHIDSYFDKHFQMPRGRGDFTKQPKDFKRILNYYEISPSGLFVIGDRYKRDILPAIKLGCNTYQVPEYKTMQNEYPSVPKPQKNYFDVNSIEVP